MEKQRADLEKAIRAIKIEVDDCEKEELGDELHRFLQWLEPLLTVDTGAVEPVLVGHGAVNVRREDRARPGDPFELQKAAPDFEDGFYPVPPIIE